MPLAAYEKKRRPPGRTLILNPWVFADDWGNKPTDDVCVGLRLMSDEAKTVARRDSEELARSLHPHGGVNMIDAFNDALMRNIIAFGLTDPNDVTQFWHGWELPEEEVKIALTTRGARFIYEAIERYEMESSPLNPEATADDLEELQIAIDNGALDLMTTARASLARRHLRYALDEIRSAPTRTD